MMTADMDRLTAPPGRPRTPQHPGAPRLQPALRPGDAPTVVVPNVNRLAAARATAQGNAVAARTGRHSVPAPSAQPAPPPPPPSRAPEPRLVRRMVLGVLIGSLTMLGVATLDSFAGAKVPVLGTLASLPAAVSGSSAREVPPPPATPGTCLMWTRPDAADTDVVDCAQPHLFEQAGSVTLASDMALPDDRQWRQLVNERCQPVVVDYLRGKFDPDGRFRVGALKPSPSKWADGDRELRCGVQSASRSGALLPLSGRAADSDQAAVHDPGTCLAIDGRTIGDPVDCAGPHAVETVGIVDLSEKFPDAFPAVGDQDAYLQPQCAKIANEYAGSADSISKKGLTVYWDNITEASWKAGSRKANCNLAALLPDRSGFAPVTGPVKGDVVVGDEPAPPVTGTQGPSTPAPPTDGPPAEEIPTATPTPAPTSEPSAPTPPVEPTRPAATTPPAPERPEKPETPEPPVVSGVAPTAAVTGR
ncbi:putative regulator of septum formation [Pseudonocardia cypriaca]|uniref:Putative regulator of septum formation n=2 Tax=Pseudonocardia cypriaca TaxID=882449 RepID=A0A543FQK9_9PSEU|nr:putative regulator of septum formation [Pseudonocardia cypriaca]